MAAAPGAPDASYSLFAGLYQRMMTGQNAAELEDEIPGLAAKLAEAAHVSAESSTDSTPYDELARQDILPDRVLDALGIPHAIDGGVKHVPAGLMHTYGYLFSQLQTAFGLKGKRWVESRVDERLGLPAGLFSPFTPRGEFLTNLTTVLSILLANPPASTIGTLSETVTWRLPDGSSRTSVVGTHLIRLAELADYQTTDVALLVYEVTTGGPPVGAGKQRRFVTAFPVGQASSTRSPRRPSSVGAAFIPRYNLYVDSAWTVTSYATPGFSK